MILRLPVNILLSTTDYELLDFGAGRKLERFGPYVLDRPAPAAEGASRSDETLWRQAHSRYERTSGESGVWHGATPLAEAWQISFGPLIFELKPGDFGHLGLFPEQHQNWLWLAEQVQAADRPLKVLNLFAYSGGSTLAAALEGAEVVHVDAARNVVQWARRNAALSGLGEAPIRWIVEDARKFVARERRRGNQYDAVILDPPSYGHGPGGEVWKCSEHLPALLDDCFALCGGQPAFVLATCHTQEIDAERLAEEVTARITPGSSANASRLECGPLTITSRAGRKLPSGVFARVTNVI